MLASMPPVLSWKGSDCNDNAGDGMIYRVLLKPELGSHAIRP